ncbi:hypothetical protein WA158_005120 [Blastocystis sp. Blastoise]
MNFNQHSVVPLMNQETKISEAICDDISISIAHDNASYDFRSMLNYSAFGSIYHLGPFNDKASNWKPMVERKRMMTLPRVILSQVSDRPKLSGMFPEINRVWISVNNTLYLWNYSKGDDFVTYSDLKNPIVSVGLVKPKKGILNADDYLLIISTTATLHLLRLSMEGPEHTVLSINTTEFCCGTEGVVLSQPIGTPEGRIFMVGNDGSLYEIIYNNDSSFLNLFGLNLHIYVNNLTRSYLAGMVPYFYDVLYKNNPIIKVKYDQGRGYLYCIDTKDSVSIYNLGDNRDKFQHLLTIDDLLNRCFRFCQHNRGISAPEDTIFAPKKRNGKDNNHVYYICLTREGIRIFLGDSRGLKKGDKYIDIIAILMPPRISSVIDRRNDSPLPPRGKEIQDIGERVQASYVYGGVSILLYKQQQNDFVCLSHDIMEHYSSSSTVPYQENVHLETLMETCVNIYEASYPSDPISQYYSSIYSSRFSPYSFLPRTLYVLTNMGLYEYQTNTTLDQLRSIVFGSHSEFNLRKFTSYFGVEETMCLLLHLAIMDPASRNTVAYYFSNSSSFVTLPTPSYMPQSRVSPFGNSIPQQRSLINSDNNRDDYNQMKYQGVKLYISRFLSCIWLSPLFSFKVKNDTQYEYTLHCSLSTLQFLYKHFISLFNFFNTELKDMPLPEHLSSLLSMMDKMKQLFALFIQLYSHPSSSLYNFTPNAKDVTTVNLQSLFINEKGTQTIRSILSEYLYDMAPYYFNRGCLLYYKLLSRTNNTHNYQDSKSLYGLLKEGITCWDHDNLLRNVCEVAEIIANKCGSFAAIDMYLYTVEELPDIYSHNEYYAKSSLVYSAYSVRMNIYKAVDDMDFSSSLVDFLNQICCSKDKLFHYYLYNHIYESPYKSYLITIKSNFIVEYLTDRDKYVLWRWYIYAKDYFSASQTMAEMASQNTGDRLESNPTLDQRIQYINTAISNFNACQGIIDVSNSSAVAENLRVCRELLVIQNTIMMHLKHKREEMDDLNEIQVIEENIQSLRYVCYPSSDLYNNFAIKYELIECALDIMNVCNSNQISHIGALWEQLINNTILQFQNESLWIPLSQKLIIWGKKYIPNKFTEMFPVMQILYTLIPVAVSRGDVPDNWFVNTFHQSGVSYDTLYSCMYTIYRSEEDQDSVILLLTILADILDAWYIFATNSLTAAEGTNKMYFISLVPQRLTEIDTYKSQLKSLVAANMISTPGALISRFEKIENNYIAAQQSYNRETNIFDSIKVF